MAKMNKKMNKKKRNDTIQRWGVIIVGALFVLSMASFAINSGSDRQTDVEIPEDNVIYGNITDMQRDMIAYYGGTIVDYSYPSDCGMECFQTKSSLEGLVETYKPYLFVVYSEGGSSPVMTVSNYYGSDVVLDVVAVEDNVCKVIVGHDACVERRAMAAVFAKNESVVADYDGLGE